MNRTQVEEIKARLPIEEIIGGYMKLEKSGKSFKGRCPFHNEKTASFFVSPDRGGYYCFGCGVKGDIFTFVEQFEGLDFRGALKMLAERAGIKLTFDKKSDGERDSLFEAMDEAAKYFELQYEKTKSAQEYVKGRGITDETRKVFRIGLAPDGWRNLQSYLKGKGFNDVILEKVGLIKKKENSSEYYDRFRGRIMFPVFDSGGRVIAFSGRILKDDGQSAKYLNSPDTPLYDKSSVLYGLDKAKSEIRRLGYSIFVEGQMDLVMSHQAGIKNTVAASGTALTDETVNKEGVISNLGLVRRLAPNVIIAFDSDAAGKKAAMRAASIALGLNMDVKIADIVGGKDPADLVKEDVEKWKEVLRNAKPVVEFELSNVIKEISDHRKLSQAVSQRVLPLIMQIETNSDKSFFVQMVSDRAKIPVDIVWQDLRVIESRLKKTDSPGRNFQTAKTSGEVAKRIDIVERRLFGLLFLMQKDNHNDYREYEEKLRKIAAETYSERSERVLPIKSDLIFEAETFFGNNQDTWKVHMNELLMNFEEDLVSGELIKTMQELRVAEQNHDNVLLSELVKKCQALSLRKAEVGKRRKS